MNLTEAQWNYVGKKIAGKTGVKELLIDKDHYGNVIVKIMGDTVEAVRINSNVIPFPKKFEPKVTPNPSLFEQFCKAAQKVGMEFKMALGLDEEDEHV